MPQPVPPSPYATVSDPHASLLQLAVMASGGGTNFQAIIDAVEAGTLSAELVLCISNNPEAGALERAVHHQIPTCVLDPGQFPEDARYEATLLEVLQDHGVTFIALAGYMRKIPVGIVRAFQGRMVNIHPALLPAFGGKGMYGRRVHQAVLDYGAQWTGATVHLVEEEYDTGPIVLQKPVAVLPDDNASTLAARVLEVEHVLYPAALQLFAEDRLIRVGRRMLVRPSTDT